MRRRRAKCERHKKFFVCTMEQTPMADPGSESTCILIDGKDPDALSSISVKLDKLSFGDSVDHTDHSEVGK